MAIVLLVLVATTVYRDLTVGKTQNSYPPAKVQMIAAEQTPVKNHHNIIKKINYKIADNEQIKAVLIDIKNVQHQVYGNSIDIGSRSRTNSTSMTVRAEEVRVDGKELDKTTVIMSEDIPAGETAEAVLTILEFEDHPLPAMQRSIEMILNVYSWEDWDFEQNHRFTVSL